MNPPLAKLLVVDDEEQLTRLIELSFTNKGFQVWTANSSVTAAQVLTSEPIDLVILDVMMPGETGLEFCRRAKTIRPVRVILLSALGSIDERISGLEAGADDYVVKPFSMKELALRVDAVLRRISIEADAELLRTQNRIQLNAAVAKGFFDGRDLLLTPSEFRLLWALFEDEDPKPWEDLFRAMGSPLSLAGGRESVRTAVYRLRAKLLRQTGRPHIETVRGIGYRIH